MFDVDLSTCEYAGHGVVGLSGELVAVPDLSAQTRRWPRFAATARDAGFTAVQALPMRPREQTIGALNGQPAPPG
jgi:hypothetical protein